MPITIEDVRTYLGAIPIIDPNSVMTEIFRRFPMGGKELEGIKKDMVITKVVRDILEQPQISGQSKWEDRFLYAKGDGATREEMSAWMQKSRRPITIRPNEYPQFFSWLKSFDMSPWDIEAVDPVRQTIKVMDKGRGLLTDIPFDAAMRHLKKGLRWSDADIFEYFEFKKSQGQEMAEALYNEMVMPNGYRLVYDKLNKGYVDVKKTVLANKSFIMPELRGREVVNVIHHSTNGHEIMLGEFYGPDAIHEAYKMAKSFANRMVQLSKANPQAASDQATQMAAFPTANDPGLGSEEQAMEPSYQPAPPVEDTDQGQWPDESQMSTSVPPKPAFEKSLLAGDGNLLTMTVDQMYKMVGR